jgi:PAS domain S-box-containing protein
MSKSASLPAESAAKTSDAGAAASANGELEALFRLSLEMLCVAGGDGYFKRVNPAFTQVLGHGSEELLARPFLDFVHPDDQQKTRAVVQGLIDGLPTVDFENRYRCRDGSYRWLSWKAMPADHGQRIYAVASDVTQRKQTEEALLESQRSYQRLLAAVTSYRYCVDCRADPHSTWHSAECVGATGYSPDDYHSQPYLWINMVHPDDREAVRRHVASVLASEDVPPIEHRIRHKNGRIRWVRDTIVLRRDVAGRLVSYDGLVQDITDRKVVEDRFRQIVEFAPDAMVVVNTEGRIVLVNEQTEKLFGYARAELFGQLVEVLTPERFSDRHAALRGTYAASPRVRRMGSNPNICCRRKDGSEFPADISLSPIESDEGMLVYAAIRDISERRRAEAAIQTNLRSQSALNEILKISLEPVSLEEQLQRILDLLLSLPWLSFQAKGAIFVADEQSQTLIMKAHSGLPEALRAGCSQVPFGKCLCGRAAASQECVFAGCIDGRHETRYPDMFPHGHYCVPIVSDGRTFGVVNLYVPEGHQQQPEEQELLSSIAHALAGAIKRKLAEESLRKSEERFELAVRGTHAGIWDWDLRTNTVYFSPRWKSMLGFGEQEIRDEFAEWEGRIHPDDRRRVLDAIHDYLEGNSPEFELEHRLRHKDGAYRWIVARGAAVRDEQGRPYRMVGSHIDVTRRKRAEAQVRDNELQLLIAQSIQARFLPQHSPHVSGFDIAGKSCPAEFTGGDMFDYISMRDGSVGLAIGDVAGHGFAPALLMASAHAYLRSLAQTSSDVGEILGIANSILAHETADDRFVTLLLGRLDPRTRSFDYCSAGHPTAYWLDASGNIKSRLESTAMALGILPDSKFSTVGPLALVPGDVLLMITDGVLEAACPNGEPFGPQRTLETIRAHLDRPSSQIVEGLFRAVRDFSQREKPLDDITALVVKCEPCRKSALLTLPGGSNGG